MARQSFTRQLKVPRMGSRPRGYIPRPPKEPKPPPVPRGRPFEKGVDARRENRGVKLAHARARFEVGTMPDPSAPLPPGFAHACDILTSTHVLPGLIACLEQKIGSPSWRWAAEMTLKYSQRPAGADKQGKDKRPALPADVNKAIRQALHDPGVRAWLAKQPGALDQLRELPEFDQGADELESETAEEGDPGEFPAVPPPQDGPGQPISGGEVSQVGGELADVPPPLGAVPPPQAPVLPPPEG